MTTFFAKKERVYVGRGLFWFGGVLCSICFMFLARRNLLERAHDTSGSSWIFLIQGSSRLWQMYSQAGFENTGFHINFVNAGGHVALRRT